MALKIFENNINPLKLKIEMDRLIPEWLDWDLSTILQTLGPITSVIENKIHALRALIKSPDNFMNDTVVFEKICLALNGEEVLFSILQTVSPSQIFHCLDIAKDLVSDLFNNLDNRIKYWIGAKCIESGLFVALPQFSFLQPYINELTKVKLSDETIKKILKKYEELRFSLPVHLLEENEVDIQVSKLLTISNILRDKFIGKEESGE